MRAMLVAGELDLALGLAPDEAGRMRSEACCRVLRRGVAWTPRLDGRILVADLGRTP